MRILPMDPISTPPDIGSTLDAFLQLGHLED